MFDINILKKHLLLTMSKYYVFIDFEFLPWKKKDGGEQIRDVISAGYIICEGSSFDITSRAYCVDMPISINLETGSCCIQSQQTYYDRIMRFLHKVPEKREALLDQLFSTTFHGSFNQSYEHSVDPSVVIKELVGESLTIIVWGGMEDMKILRALLGDEYDNIKFCNVTCIREDKQSNLFLLTLSEGKTEIFALPFGEFPKKNGNNLNLMETHDAVCSDNHGQSHDPLVDCTMLECLVRKTTALHHIYNLF